MASRTLAASRVRRRRNGTRWSVRLELKPADLWVGAYWTTTTGPTHRWAVLDLWVCLVPCLPVHLFANRRPVGVTRG